MSKMTATVTIVVMLCGHMRGASRTSDVFQTAECPAGLQETLERGGFSGVVLCGKPNAEAAFALVGTAATRDAKYTVYDYRYRFLPEEGNVWHGGQRLIIIRNNEYLGQFVLSGDLANIKLTGTKLVLSKPDVKPVSIDLGKGVPNTFLFDGDVMHFER